jgi:hypothetical protein
MHTHLLFMFAKLAVTHAHLSSICNLSTLVVGLCQQRQQSRASWLCAVKTYLHLVTAPAATVCVLHQLDPDKQKCITLISVLLSAAQQ